MNDPHNNVNSRTGVPMNEAAIANGILKQNLVNLAKRLKEGKVLTPAEVNLVREALGSESATPITGVAKNQVALSNALGVERKTIQRWLKEPGCPGAKPNGSFAIEEWKLWADSTGRKIGDQASSKGELQEENLRLQNRRILHQLRILTREFVPVSEVESVGSRLGASIRKVVTKLHLIAPTLDGRNASEIEAILREKEDEIMEQLHALSEGIEEMRKSDVPDAMSVDGDEDDG